MSCIYDGEPAIIFDGSVDRWDISDVLTVIKGDRDMKTQTRRVEASQFTPQDRFQELVNDLSKEYTKSILANGKEDDPLASIKESADFDVPPHIQALIRLNKKVFALKKHAQNRSLNVLTVQKKAMEIATLALMAIVLIEE
jgi:hypothetical protein